MNDNMTRITIGTVTAWAVRDGELILKTLLTQPVNSATFLERAPQVSEFRDGSPLGFKIEPRFDGVKKPGETIEISVLDRDVVNPGVPEANGPQLTQEVRCSCPSRKARRSEKAQSPLPTDRDRRASPRWRRAG
jgi:hypothetical protein